MTQRGQGRGGPGWGVALAALLLGALWPWLGRLGTVPVTMDGALWVGRSDLGAEGWWRWDLLTSHFIGYRPLTALTFTVDSALTGLDPLAYRLTDLGLHVGVLGMVWLLFRALAPDRPRWAALVAVAAVAAHPAVQEAVPLMARRSYLLATLLGAFSVLSLSWEVKRGGWPWRSSLLLLAAMLSNESAYALVAVLPVISWHLSPPASWRAAAARLAGPGAAMAAAVALRLGITGQVGGYGGMGPSLVGSAEVAGSAWGYLLFPASATDEPTRVLGGVAGMAVVGAWLVWGAVVRPWLHRREPSTRLPAVLAAWALAHIALYMATGRWYVREAYPVLLPLGLLVAVLAADGLRARRGRAVAEGVAALVLAVAVLTHSPLLRGPDPVRSHQASLYQARVDSLLAELGALEGPAVVWLVVPVAPAHRETNQGRRVVRYQARRLSTWVGFVAGREGVRVEDAVYLLDERHPSHPEGSHRIALPEGAQLKTPRGMEPPGHYLSLADLPPAEAGVVVYGGFFEGTEARLVRLTGPGDPSQSGGHGREGDASR